jgi:hypothetical protein
MKFRDELDKVTAQNVVQISVKGATKTLAMIKRAFKEEKLSRTQKIQIHRGQRKTRQVKSEVKSMLTFFFEIRGIYSQRIISGMPNRTNPNSVSKYVTKRKMTVFPHSPYFTLFPRMKIKLKSLQFDTIEVKQAASHTVLNTLTEHDFRHGFKNGRSRGNVPYARKGNTSRMMAASRHKVIF